MKIKAIAELRLNRTTKVLLGISATIFLGALGSGLWELFLRGPFIALGNFALALFASLWSGYLDVLHQKIGSTRYDPYLILVYSVTFVSILSFPIFALTIFHNRLRRLFRHIESIDKEEEPNSRARTREELIRLAYSFRRLLYRVFAPIVLISTLTYLFIDWHISYIRDAADWTERSIEILRPYVSQDEALRLYSDFRAIQSAAQFYRLEDHLREISVKTSVELPKFKSVRVAPSK